MLCSNTYDVYMMGTEKSLRHSVWIKECFFKDIGLKIDSKMYRGTGLDEALYMYIERYMYIGIVALTFVLLYNGFIILSSFDVYYCSVLFKKPIRDDLFSTISIAYKFEVWDETLL